MDEHKMLPLSVENDDNITEIWQARHLPGYTERFITPASSDIPSLDSCAVSLDSTLLVVACASSGLAVIYLLKEE